MFLTPQGFAFFGLLYALFFAVVGIVIYFLYKLFRKQKVSKLPSIIFAVILLLGIAALIYIS